MSNNLESMSYERAETINEINDAGSEFIGHTEITNFNESEFFSNEQISQMIRELIPVSHLESCPKIEYMPDFHPESRNILGTFYIPTHEIFVWGEAISDSNLLTETVVHEIGHNVHTELFTNQPYIENKWADLHQESWKQFELDGFGFVSSYARSDMYEDFAETYKIYITDPEFLQFISPQKYQFMQQEVFAAREYRYEDGEDYADASKLPDQYEEQSGGGRRRGIGYPS